MLDTLRKRHERDEDGFTLIELMVVVLIIAILLAIAIPTFLGARERAQNRAAQSDIRNTLTAEKTYYTDKQVYVDDSTGLIKAIEPSITYVAGAGTNAAVGIVVSTASVANDSVCISKVSKSGKAFSVLDIATGTTAGTYFYNDGTCNGESGATAAPTGSKTGWS